MELKFIEEDGLPVLIEETAAKLTQLGPFVSHSNFHRLCQLVYNKNQETKPSGQHTDLNRLGYHVIRSFTSSQSASTFSKLFSNEINKTSVSTNTSITPSGDLKLKVMDLITSSMGVDVERLIESYFSSYFRIDHFQLFRTQVAPEVEVSFRWHRDLEPISQLHIMLYLTDSKEGDATTVFTSLEDTRRCAKHGYTFPDFKDRLDDINLCLPEGAPRVEVSHPILAAGDATIFAAPRILHKGCTPRQNHRDVLLINILPSLVPWQKEIEVLGYQHLFDERNTFFINPFARGAPSYSSEDFVYAVPDWVAQSNFFSDD